MSKIVLKSLSVLLGAFFIFLGVLKITPKISRDLHKDLRAEYAKYAKVFPLAKYLEYKLPSKWYRRTVGVLEIAAGLVLVSPFPVKWSFGAGSLERRSKNAANLLLLGLKMLNVYTHWAINDQFERTAPTLVFVLLLSCRLVVDWQLARAEKAASTTTTPPAASYDSNDPSRDNEYEDDTLDAARVIRRAQQYYERHGRDLSDRDHPPSSLSSKKAQ